MQGERNLLHNYVMPILQQWCNSLHVQVWVKDASERNSNRAIILEHNNKGFFISIVVHCRRLSFAQ